YILFPYQKAGNAISLIPSSTMKAKYPKAWAHLGKYEEALRGRESNGFDDDDWYRFGRNQNIDKQDKKKLIVAQTVPHMRVSSDENGDFSLNNVRVNGILPADDAD